MLLTVPRTEIHFWFGRYNIVEVASFVLKHVKRTHLKQTISQAFYILVVKCTGKILHMDPSLCDVAFPKPKL